MYFTKETKECFIELFGNHEVVTISRRYGNTPASYEHKFIGVHNGMKWDFTPMIIDLSGCHTNKSELAARGFSKTILTMAFLKLREEGFEIPENFFRSTSDFCQIFYF